MAISGKNLHQVYMTKLHLGVLYGCRWIYKQAQRSKARHTCPMNKPLTLLLWAVLLLELLGRAIPLPEADFVLKPLLMPILCRGSWPGKPQALAAHTGHGCAVLLMARGHLLAVRGIFCLWLGKLSHRAHHVRGDLPERTGHAAAQAPLDICPISAVDDCLLLVCTEAAWKYDRACTWLYHRDLHDGTCSHQPLWYCDTAKLPMDSGGGIVLYEQ